MNTSPSLTRADFAAFFSAVRGYPPFPWQERLLDHVLREGRWPHHINAPTGSGKTAVVDVHVFANALSAIKAGPRVPRRLSVVVNRRLIVDSHHDYAGRLAAELATPQTDLVATVAEALRSLVPDEARVAGSPVLLRTMLRGGIGRDASWRVQPEACAVLTCTPDMWGSRLLLRGYGTSRRARPQEAGLLAWDSVVVVDEAHLTRQLVMTAKRVADLAARHPALGEVPSLQVVDTTATPADAADSAADVVSVEDADLQFSEVLNARLTRPKPVRLLPLAEWPVKTPTSREAMAKVVATAVEKLRSEAAQVQRSPDRHLTVGCVLNRVEDAAAVADALTDAGLRVALLTGRMRPVDRARLAEAHPTLLTTDGSPEVDVLVATQTIEVGVDVDLAAMVTDLAPASALAQRAGRVNRLGRRASGALVVLMPSAPITVAAERTGKERSALYSAGDLHEALTWLEPIAASPDGMAPWKLATQHRPPATEARRIHLQRISLSDVAAMARTSEAGHAELDLALWLQDDLHADTTVGVVFRRLSSPPLAPSLESVATFLEKTPPLEHELVNLRFGALRQLVGSYLAAARQRHTVAPLYRFRPGAGDEEGTVSALPVVTATGEDVAAIALRGTRPDDVVVLDAGLVEVAGLATWTWRSSSAGSSSFEVDAYDTVSPGGSADEEAWSGRLRIGHLSRFDGAEFLEAVREYRDAEGTLGEEPDQEAVRAWDADRRAALAAALSAALSAIEVPEITSDLLAPVIEALTGPVADLDVVVSEPDDSLEYLVLRAEPSRVMAGEVLSVVGREQVALAAHQLAVAARAAASARTLGLPPDLVTALELAGLHHDDGKSDARFQVRLGARGAVQLAKSGPEPFGVARQRAMRSGLRIGWRHEQLSALLTQQALGAGGARAGLVTRLVGTSHGVGRPSFPHSAQDLLPRGEVTPDAEDLFDLGGWETLVEATDAEYGVWTVAYLEALLRAADVRVSQEGS